MFANYYICQLTAHFIHPLICSFIWSILKKQRLCSRDCAMQCAYDDASCCLEQRVYWEKQSKYKKIQIQLHMVQTNEDKVNWEVKWRIYFTFGQEGSPAWKWGVALQQPDCRNESRPEVRKCKMCLKKWKVIVD